MKVRPKQNLTLDFIVGETLNVLHLPRILCAIHFVTHTITLAAPVVSYKVSKRGQFLCSHFIFAPSMVLVNAFHRLVLHSPGKPSREDVRLHWVRNGGNRRRALQTASTSVASSSS